MSSICFMFCPGALVLRPSWARHEFQSLSLEVQSKLIFVILSSGKWVKGLLALIACSIRREEILFIQI